MARKAKKRRHNWVVCPWCRKTDALFVDSDGGYADNPEYWVRCDRCDLAGPGTSATVSWAVRKWNKWADKPWRTLTKKET